MTSATTDARHLSLVRLEQAAGQAFGCLDEANDPAEAKGSLFVSPTTIALATVATAVAATITYLV